MDNNTFIQVLEDFIVNVKYNDLMINESLKTKIVDLINSSIGLFSFLPVDIKCLVIKYAFPDFQSIFENRLCIMALTNKNEYLYCINTISKNIIYDIHTVYKRMIEMKGVLLNIMENNKYYPKYELQYKNELVIYIKFEDGHVLVDEYSNMGYLLGFFSSLSLSKNVLLRMVSKGIPSLINIHYAKLVKDSLRQNSLFISPYEYSETITIDMIDRKIPIWYVNQVIYKSYSVVQNPEKKYCKNVGHYVRVVKEMDLKSIG